MSSRICVYSHSFYCILWIASAYRYGNAVLCKLKIICCVAIAAITAFTRLKILGQRKIQHFCSRLLARPFASERLGISRKSQDLVL